MVAMGHAGRGQVASARMARRRVRLTRRGRVVVLLVLLMLAGLGVLFVATASRAADQAKESPVTVVAPGDTLWSIAARRVGRGDPRGMVERIRRLNGLADYSVYPGQQLRLPPGR